MTDDQKYQYEKLIAARNYHYDNLNKWLMSFYVIIGALFVALYSLHSKGEECRMLVLCVAFVGYIVSIAAYLSGKGYYYWETSWIMLIHNFEKKCSEEGKDDYRVYSVFANKNANNDKNKITSGANISTSKVALITTWVIAIVWGAMAFFFGACMLLQEYCCGGDPLKLCCELLVGLASVGVSYGTTKWLLKKTDCLQSDLRDLDDLELPID